MHKEAEFLQKLLPGYYMNLNQGRETCPPPSSWQFGRAKSQIELFRHLERGEWIADCRVGNAVGNILIGHYYSVNCLPLWNEMASTQPCRIHTLCCPSFSECTCTCTTRRTSDSPWWTTCCLPTSRCTSSSTSRGPLTNERWERWEGEGDFKIGWNILTTVCIPGQQGGACQEVPHVQGPRLHGDVSRRSSAWTRDVSH